MRLAGVIASTVPVKTALASMTWSRTVPVELPPAARQAHGAEGAAALLPAGPSSTHEAARSRPASSR